MQRDDLKLTDFIENKMVTIVTFTHEGRKYAMPCSWAYPISHVPEKVAVFIKKTRATCQAMKLRSKFTLSIPSQTMIVHQLALHSSFDKDKIEHLGLAWDEKNDRLLTDCFAWVMCLMDKVVDVGGSHLMFVATIEKKMLAEGKRLDRDAVFLAGYGNRLSKWSFAE